MSGPLYLQIAAELRRNITDGVYKVGQRIPTEDNLSKRFGVNRHTLRRAVGLLASEGLVRVDQGRGTFVADLPIHYPIGERVRFNDSLRAQGLEPSYRMLRALALPATVTVARALDITEGEEVAMIERLGLADHVPIKIATGYFPLRRFPDILPHLEQTRSISQLFRETYHCDHLRKRTTISALAASAEDARLLGLSLHQPLLLVESVNTDQHGRVIEYGVTRFRGDRTALDIENS